MGRVVSRIIPSVNKMFARTMKNCVGEVGREGKKQLPTKTHIKGPTILPWGVVLKRRRSGGAAWWIRAHSDIYDLDTLM